VPILCYHSVDGEWDDPMALPPPSFAEQCAWLAEHREVVPLTDLLDATSMGGRGRRATAITFDDGFADFASEAAPVLARHSLPVTHFLVAQTLEPGKGGADWLRPQPDPAPATMTTDQVLELQESGVRFGSHSWAHRELTELSEAECVRDLRDSRELLEDLLHEPVRLLAYPYGSHAPHVRRAADKAGYRFSFSLPAGPEANDDQAVPRVGIYRRDSMTAVRIKCSSWYMPLQMSPLRPALRQGNNVLRRLTGRAA